MYNITKNKNTTKQTKKKSNLFFFLPNQFCISFYKNIKQFFNTNNNKKCFRAD